MEVHVGTCGFPTSKNVYFKKFDTVEIQETFYNLPTEKTAKKWKELAPEGFIYTMKAWQGITHPSDSPTWKRYKARRKIDLSKYGNFSPTEEVFEAWEETAKFAEELGAKVVILQSPPSFKPSLRNIKNVENFFSSIKKYSFKIGWEPRGEWLEDKKTLKKIISKFDIIHVVDPFWDEPVEIEETCYFRLHGLGRRYNYRYEYNEKDLKKLIEILEELKCKETYVMFNVIKMLDCAEKFKEILEKK